jgi:hypothetical protein
VAEPPHGKVIVSAFASGIRKIEIQKTEIKTIDNFLIEKAYAL